MRQRKPRESEFRLSKMRQSADVSRKSRRLLKELHKKQKLRD